MLPKTSPEAPKHVPPKPPQNVPQTSTQTFQENPQPSQECLNNFPKALQQVSQKLPKHLQRMSQSCFKYYVFLGVRVCMQEINIFDLNNRFYAKETTAISHLQTAGTQDLDQYAEIVFVLQTSWQKPDFNKSPGTPY